MLLLIKIQDQIAVAMASEENNLLHVHCKKLTQQYNVTFTTNTKSNNQVTI